MQIVLQIILVLFFINAILEKNSEVTLTDASKFDINAADLKTYQSAAYPAFVFVLDQDYNFIKLFLGLAPAPQINQGTPVFIFGSGIKHHYVLKTIYDEDILFSFDAHTDCRSFGNMIDCGNWVRWVYDNITIIGVSKIVKGESFLDDDRNYLPEHLINSGRVLVYPASPSVTFFKKSITGNNSISHIHKDIFLGGSAVQWKTLKEFTPPVQKKANITIDLDCLKNGGFDVEWPCGEMTFDELMTAITKIRAGNKITAMSVCGFAETQPPGGQARLNEILRAILESIK